MAGNRVVVIGARGFVGRRVVQQLAQGGQFQPIAAIRGASASDTTVGCDASDLASVTAALQGADFVVNCVAGNAETLLSATRNICAAARSTGVRRVVHLSSMAVYGSAQGLIDESHALDPSLGWYAQAKVECEAELQRFVAAGSDGVILRPGCIHGPGSTQWTTRIARLLQQHRLGDLGAAGDGGCNLIHVGDVAAAIEAALIRPGLSGAAFNLADPNPGTWNEYFMAFGRAIGATPVSRITRRRLKIEGKVLAIPLKLLELAASRAKLGQLPFEPLPNSLLALFRQDIRLDHRQADAMLDFARTAPDVAIADAAGWFLKRAIGPQQG